jgi:hypothetical protein
LLWVAAFVLGLFTSTQARDHAPLFPKDTPVLVVGEITSPPKTRLGEQKLQVTIGPERIDYTLHFFRAEVLDVNGRALDEGAFDRGMWVRAEGRIMNDTRRVKVSRLQVIAVDRAGLIRSAFLPLGQEQGYITAVAGSRQTFVVGALATIKPAPTVIVGRVGEDYRPQDSASGFTLQAAGATWQLQIPEEARSNNSASPAALQPGQWARVYGWRTDDLRLRVTRIEPIGKDADLRRSTAYRIGNPLGYAERVDPTKLERRTVRGKVRSIDTEHGYLTLQTADQRELRVWTPAAEITVPNRPHPRDYRVGEEIEVSLVTFR